MNGPQAEKLIATIESIAKMLHQHIKKTEEGNGKPHHECSECIKYL